MCPKRPHSPGAGQDLIIPLQHRAAGSLWKTLQRKQANMLREWDKSFQAELKTCLALLAKYRASHLMDNDFKKNIRTVRQSDGDKCL
jgi:hypothetical protein